MIILLSVLSYNNPSHTFVNDQVLVGDWTILIPPPVSNVILFCLLLDNAFEQVLRFAIFVIASERFGRDNILVDTANIYFT